MSQSGRPDSGTSRTPKPCLIEGCEKSSLARGFCAAHYASSRRSGALDSLRGNMNNCSVDGCDRPEDAKSYCYKHYQYWHRHGVPSPELRPIKRCSVVECTRSYYGRGFCSLHHSRWRFTGDPLRTRTGRANGKKTPCSVDGCTRPFMAKGYCHMHYRRVYATGETGPAGAYPIRRQFTNSEGYIRVLRPAHPNADHKGYVLEHRLVMAESLGRPLTTTEIVHHRNGQRHDNRLDNLVLLTRETHPTGHEHVTCPSCGHAFEVTTHPR